MKNILVTGGAGFIGTHLIKKLKDLYTDSVIVSIDNYFTGKISNHVNGVVYIKGNTCDISELLSWNVSLGTNWVPDIVFHLGEYSRIVKSFADIDIVWESNIYGTKKVIDYCIKHSCKIIYAGSSSKFGNNGADENLSPYAWTKAKNIELIKNYGEWFGLEYAICYFYNVYGPGQIQEGPYSTVIGIFERQYKNNEPLTVVSPGTQSRDFTHIYDIIDGVVLVGKNGKGDGYMIGSGSPVTILDVVNYFNAPYVIIPERRGERLSGQATTTKMFDEFGWIPKYRLDNYIKSVIGQEHDVLHSTTR